MILKIHSKLKHLLLPLFAPHGRKFGYGPERRNLLIRPLRLNVVKDLSSVAVVS